MKVFVLWFQADWKWIFQWESLFFCSEAYWFFSMRVFVFLVSLIFQWECLFFGVRAIENRFFNESLCFFGLRHCGRRCCALFSFEFVDFLRPESVFKWECLFFWSQAFWKLIFHWERVFFFLRHCGRRCCALFFIWICRVFKNRIVFSMKVFVFLVWGILKIDFPAVGNILVLVVAFSYQRL